MVFEKIKDIIVDKLHVDASIVTMEAKLNEDLKADSLDGMEVVMEIESQFNIDLSEVDPSKFQTVGDLVKVVEEMTK